VTWRRFSGKGVATLPSTVAFGLVVALRHTLCKTVGIAYVGSNPTPATTGKKGV